MEKRIIFLLVMFLPVCAWAADVSYFEVSPNIAQPVTIKTNLGTFSFSGSYTLNGHVSRLEAFDAHGNRIVNTQPYKSSIGTSGVVNWYRFSDIYGNSSPSSSSSSSYSRPSESASWQLFQGVMGLGSYSDDAYNLQVRGGWSRYHAENISLKGGLAGMYLMGTLGKDFINKNERKPLRWSAGAGMRLIFDDILSDFCFGIKLGNRGLGLDGFVDTEWTSWLFDSNFGIYANVGLATPFDKEYIFALESFYLDVQVGIAVKLFGW